MAQSKFLTLSGLSKYDTKIKNWLKTNIKALGNKAFVHMCSLEARETHNAYKITTNWNKSQNIMPTINIRGYAYQRKETIDCDIALYHYSDNATNYTLTNKGSYPINVYQTFENDIQVFYIDPGEYYGMFNVFVYGGMGTESFSGWTMTTATSVSGTKIDQKPIATSITGNANYASSAGSSTYAARLGDANGYYTKASLDTALSGKAASSHGNHVPDAQSANNAIFLRNDNKWATITPANIGAAEISQLDNYLPLSGGDLIGTTDYENLPDSNNLFGTGKGLLHIKNSSSENYAGNAITWAYGKSDAAQAGIYVTTGGSYGSVMWLGTTNSFANGVYAALKIDTVGKIHAVRNNFVGNLTGTASTASYASMLGNANGYYTKTTLDNALAGKAASSHGNHVPDAQSANNAIFLRNDNKWATITPANIGAATSESLEALTTTVSNGLTDLSNNYSALTTSITNLETTLGNVQTQVGTNTNTIGVLNVAVEKIKDETVGSATKPIYWKDGTPTECTYKLEKNVPSNALFTDTNYYPTEFNWTNGTTDGPTGTITMNDTSKNVSVGAIPAASGVAYGYVDGDIYTWTPMAQQSGIVTTGTQSFSGQKFFNDGIWLGTHEYDGDVGTDAVKIHFGDTDGVWIGEEIDDALTLYAGGTKITLDSSDSIVNIIDAMLTVDNEPVALQSDITPPMKYTSKTLTFSAYTYLDNPTVNYCTLCSFNNTTSTTYPRFYIRFNASSYPDGSMFHFIIKKTTSQTIVYYMTLYISSTISGSSVKIAGLNTAYAYINKAFTSLEINVLYSNKVFYAIINQYK